MVIVAHYIGQYPFLSIFSSSGVTMFFVLSGFLITQILIYEKVKFRVQGFSEWTKILSILKIFYIRRALRIFPLFYLVLIILFLLNYDSARKFWGYHFFYASNFLYSFKISFDGLAHFWSLAVEEQFYLVWPLLILAIPGRLVSVRFFSFLIAASVVFKICLLFLYWPNSLPSYCMMPSCVESFASGAIALIMCKKEIKIGNLRLLLILSLLAFIPLQVMTYWNPSDLVLFISSAFSRTIFSFISAGVLLIAVKGYYGKIGSFFFNNRLLLLIGKISYGVYIYHMFMPRLIGFFMDKVDIDLRGYGKLLFLEVFCTIGLAYISYFYFELPVNKLKKNFKY